MLQKFGEVSAMEMEEFAVNHALKITKNVKKGHLPNNITYDEKFDLICLFDVLEHVDDDQTSINNIKKLLKTDGILLITVPAYQWLYGSHDKLLHHKRRYQLNQLEDILIEFKTLKKSYFNTFLFPLVTLSRIIDKMIVNKKASLGYDIPNKVINTIFYNIFKSEKKFLSKINFTFGSSILFIVRNNASQ